MNDGLAKMAKAKTLRKGESVPTTTVQEYIMEFYPWADWSRIKLPEKKGYRVAELIAFTKDGKFGVKVAWLKLD